jgi:protein SCO1/2
MSTSILPSKEVQPNERRPFWSNWRIWAAAIALLFALGISILFGSKQAAQRDYYGQRLFPPKQAFDFALINQDAEPFQLQQLHGKVIIFLFGFTHCPNVCPTSLTNLAAVYQKLDPEQRKRVQILFLSVDAQRDTPAALKSYVPWFDPSIIGLTGSKEAIDRTVQEYGGSYEIVPGSSKDPTDYGVNHSAYIYLINPAGQLELLYDNEKLADTDRMVGDIRKVLAEKK